MSWRETLGVSPCTKPPIRTIRTIRSNPLLRGIADLSIFRKNRPNFWTIYLWQRVLTDLNHQAFTHCGLRPKTG
jgi:hypothetical protein